MEFVKQKDIKTHILYFNTKLKSALHFYYKHGFYEIKLEKRLYERADIEMEKYLYNKPLLKKFKRGLLFPEKDI